MHKVFKPLLRDDSIEEAYLHADGHVIVEFSRRDSEGIYTYYKQAKNIGIECAFHANKGKLRFKDTLLLIAISLLPNVEVKAVIPWSCENAYIEVCSGNDTFRVENGHGFIYYYDFDELFNSKLTEYDQYHNDVFTVE